MKSSGNHCNNWVMDFWSKNVKLLSLLDKLGLVGFRKFESTSAAIMFIFSRGPLKFSYHIWRIELRRKFNSVFRFASGNWIRPEDQEITINDKRLGQTHQFVQRPSHSALISKLGLNFASWLCLFFTSKIGKIVIKVL